MTVVQTAADSRIREASGVVPSARQLAWQHLEFYGFIHFGMNTMTDREWGEGHEDPQLFDPADLDADEWVRSLMSAGMRAVILTCKHHDGFCLWPSRHSAHTVAHSPWRDGEGDIVGDVARACQKYGLKFGVYLSPWDMTESSYGSGGAYDDFFVAQLTELLTGYGPIFCVWLDGANGEGPDGRRQYYDWDRYYEVIRTLQPDAVISVCGPDVRWCGNEAGHTRPDEWSVVPASLRNAELTASRSQKADDGEFSRLVLSDEEDLGSRQVILENNEPLVWYPAEVNTSIRPGWFHHPEEDAHVRSATELFEIYRRSVGGNSTFLLNVPPDRRGRISEPDRRALSQLGGLIAGIAKCDLLPTGTITFSSSQVTGPDGTRGLVWRPQPSDSAPFIDVEWSEPIDVVGIVLGESIRHGQQVENCIITAVGADGGSVELARLSSVGHQRIIDIESTVITKIRVEFVGFRGPVAVDLLRVLGTRVTPLLDDSRSRAARPIA